MHKPWLGSIKALIHRLCNQPWCCSLTSHTNRVSNPDALTVGLVAELPPPVGGMAIQAVLITQLLRNAGHEVVNVRTNPLAANSLWRNVPVLRGLINLIGYCRALSNACPRVGVVHVFSNSYLSFFLFTGPAVICAKLFRKPVVIHYHGGAAEVFLQQWGLLALPLLRMAQALIVPSTFLVEAFSKHALETSVVPNVLSADLPFRRRHPLRPHFVMARHLEPAYNTACGLRAFRLILNDFDQAQLVVAGGGSERGAMERLADELGLAEHVTFTGPVSNEQMTHLYDQADIYLNSSRVDNQPVSILEAFACGLPVVSTAAGGIPYLVQDGKDALLAPVDDSEDLAKQALRLLRDPELASRLAANGRVRAEAFCEPHVYRCLRSVYTRIV